MASLLETQCSFHLMKHDHKALATALHSTFA
jgi:hypothetical protein